MYCTFFGHRDAPTTIISQLEQTVEMLIKEKSVTNFYIGNHGNFDKMALSVVSRLKKRYPQIKYEIVLAYIPTVKNEHPTIFPEGIEKAPKRFAICFRNKWMVENSDFVISYIKNNFGGAYRYTMLAKRRGKTIYNIFLKNSVDDVEIS